MIKCCDLTEKDIFFYAYNMYSTYIHSSKLDTRTHMHTHKHNTDKQSRNATSFFERSKSTLRGTCMYIFIYLYNIYYIS